MDRNDYIKILNFSMAWDIHINKILKGSDQLEENICKLKKKKKDFIYKKNLRYKESLQINIKRYIA